MSDASAMQSDVSDAEEQRNAPAVDVGTVKEAPTKAADDERRRKRDGAIVKKSTINRHLAKLAKKELRKKKLDSIGHKDDFPLFRAASAADWALVRHHAGTEMANALLRIGILGAESHTLVRFEMEAAHEAVLAEPGAYSDEALGSVTEWVLLLAQQAKALQNRCEWSMASAGDVEKWSLGGLYSLMEPAVDIRLSSFTNMNFVNTARILTNLLSKAFENKWSREHLHPLRKVNPSEAWLHTDIAKAKPPKRVYGTVFTGGPSGANSEDSE
jgi:hypothetical protein